MAAEVGASHHAGRFFGARLQSVEGRKEDRVPSRADAPDGGLRSERSVGDGRERRECETDHAQSRAGIGRGLSRRTIRRFCFYRRPIRSSRPTTTARFSSRPQPAGTRKAADARSCRTKWSSASWSKDGKSIFFLANMGVHTELFKVAVQSIRSRSSSPPGNTPSPAGRMFTDRERARLHVAAK